MSNQFKKLVQKRCEKWKKFLELNEYTIEYDFDNNIGLNGHPAGASFDYKYLTINLQFAKEFEDDYNEFGNDWFNLTLIHELLHLFTFFFDEPLKKHLGKKEYEFYDERDEQMIERLSKTLYNIYKK